MRYEGATSPGTPPMRDVPVHAGLWLMGLLATLWLVACASAPTPDAACDAMACGIDDSSPLDTARTQARRMKGSAT